MLVVHAVLLLCASVVKCASGAVLLLCASVVKCAGVVQCCCCVLV